MTAAGLCADCRHARLNQTRRGPVYLRCQLAAVDEAYPRYPRLPVLSCPGYQPAEKPSAATSSAATLSAATSDEPTSDEPA